MTRIRLAYMLESLDAWEPQRRAAAVAAALPVDEFDVQWVAPKQHSIGEVLRLANIAADVIHLADAWSTSHVGPLLALRRQTPYVCTIDDYRREATWFRRRLEKFVYGRAAAVVANDPAVAERRRAECGLSFASPWLVKDDRPLLPSGQLISREIVCAELNVPLEARLIGTFGPLTAAQNTRDVIWLEALLRLLYEDTYVIIIGDGPKFASLQSFAAAMHVTDRVRFVTQAAAFDRIVPHLTLYVDAARWSGPSSALFAAQAAGVPVLAIDTPVRRRELAPDRSGYLVAEHDRAAVTRRCYKLLEDESLRQSFAAAGREFAATVRQSASQSAASFAELYRTALRLSPCAGLCNCRRLF